MMLYLEQFVYTNKLRSIHPLEKLLFSLLTIGICLAAERITLSVAVMLLMLGILVVGAKIPGRVLVKLLIIPLGFLIVGIATIAMVVSSQGENMLASLYLGGVYWGVTAFSLTLAAKTGITSLSSLACLYFLALTTPLSEIIYALRLLKLPAILIELMTLIYRFIFVFLETSWQIYVAQWSRWGYGTFTRSLHSLGLLVANVWGRAFFKTQTLYTGLVSRGYDQDLNFLSPGQRPSLRTCGLFALADLVFIVLALI